MVPEVAFWGFWGLVCIEKWSQNFDSGTRSAIFGTPKMAVFFHFGGSILHRKWHNRAKTEVTQNGHFPSPAKTDPYMCVSLDRISKHPR